MRKFILLAFFALLAALGNPAFATGSEYYDHTTFPASGAQLSSSAMRAELDLIEAGFGKLPDLSGNGSKLVRVNSGATALEAMSQGLLTNGTAQATTSGTNIDFTSIPSWVKSITISFAGVSTNSTSNYLIQIGDSGGIEATGYLGAAVFQNNGGTNTVANYTTGFGAYINTAAAVVHGTVELRLLDASTNTWAASGVLAQSDIGRMTTLAGSKSLSATLDRVRITTVSGDTFDAGSVNIQYH